MGKSLLTLDTLEPDRDFIVINEKPFFLRADGEMSLTQMAKIRRLSTEIVETGEKGVTIEGMTLVEEHINEILDMILIELPVDVRDKLSKDQKFKIVRVFTDAAVRRQKAAAEKNQTSEG